MAARDAGRGIALLLAAGASTRLEGHAKALLPVGEESAIRRIARLADDAGWRRRMAVVGAHAQPIRRELEGAGVEVLENPEWASGRTGSVQLGLSVARSAERLLLWPVDHPFVDPPTLTELERAADADPMACWILPSFRGRGGHPVLIGRSVFPAIEALSPDRSLRSLLPALGPQLRRLPVQDPGVVAKVETPEGYRRLLAEWVERQEGARWTVD